MKTLLATYYLVTFLCTDSTMQDCEIYKSKPMLDVQCEKLSNKILSSARKFELPETVITYCTEDVSDLPVEGEKQW